ncbi:FAD/NAD(P)-dependent oxidoreductase [Chitinasiproducens palmae]|uniref:NADPH-dependent 2,4-dienoyl-CoA reductase, sulfur reductase n=1 Tax=Chitinasiproducens palmae TaxID=1770053 RepID=A0A1H2PN14_9BURK|nr:NAD(P)/FAD-dependent oxidoreductase [Chitinasiproducens palmae]SDV48031.1 NADPH-dependent 2,4-dienoyl-CoA reductase, sulfur reductase [Chitinasiproducens palmae]
MKHDLIVIGAGPAGMAAAATAGELGLKVVVLDEQARAGGQIYRNVGIAGPRVRTLLGSDYEAGGALLKRFEQAAVDVRNGALVWDIARDGTVSMLRAGRAEQLRADHVLLASGAMERPSPIPGWTLPGVMNAGAAQIALKSGPSIPDGKIVLAGTGPLLLLVACQLLAAGAQLKALVETAPRENRLAALRALPAALRAPKPLLKGLRMLATLRRAGVPWYKHATELAVVGDERAREFRFLHEDRHVVVPADVVLLHHGVIPNPQLTRLLRLEHRWSDAQLAWQPVRDAWGASSLDRVWLAGDGAGIDGARAAEATGTLAALGIAHALGRIDQGTRDARANPWQRQLLRERAVRPFLEALYRPPHWVGSPADDALVCRCEEVTAGRIREMARMGCAGPNQTKFFSRCGMGPCQGRLCGTTVTQILAEARDESPQRIGAYRVRAPIKPIPLDALAGMHVESQEVLNSGDFSE